MLRYLIAPLSHTTLNDLLGRQAEVDAEINHEARYKKAKDLFGRKTPKRAFDEVKSVLAQHSPAGSACFYCERDRYRDIEHVRPKRHYPELCFDWNNYVYACTICNQDAKKDKFAVFDRGGNVISFDRSLAFDQPVPDGESVLIDIRLEDPLDYLQLDLRTGRFVAIGISARDKVRGEYTRDLFNLDNDVLARIRQQAVAHFTDYIVRYVKSKQEGNEEAASRLISEILELPHPTVLVEMRRQSSSFPALDELIRQLPPELGRRA